MKSRLKANPFEKSSPRKTKKTRRKKKLKYNRRRLLLLFIISVILVWMVYPSYRERLEQQKIRLDLGQRVEELREKNEALKKESARLQSKDYVEQVAREDLGLVKPGEIAYLVVPPTQEEETTSPRSAPRSQKTFWQKLSSFFGKLFD